MGGEEGRAEREREKSQNNVASLPTIQLAKSLAGKLPSQQNLNNKHYV